ncbi:MAG: ShlB/FhaC/HecB family hemolysin secretion/activation protein [Leptolyngbyaceae cyanobacterium]
MPMCFRVCILTTGGVVLSCIAPVQAQVPYAQADPQLDPLPVPAPLPDEVPLETPAPDTPDTPSSESIPIEVTQIQVVGSTVFTPEELAELVAPFENRTTTLAELQSLAGELNQRYLNAGYITTQVRIPEQTLIDGRVVLEVLEGELADITVEGSDRYQTYITSRLNRASTAPLNQLELEDALQLLELEGVFDSVQADLEPGRSPGTSLLSVRVEEANPFQGQVFSDAYSPSSVGRVRVGTQLQYRGLVVPGDTAIATVSTTTTGGAQAYNLGYQVPIAANNSTLRFGFTYEDFEITDEDNPAFALDIEGQTLIYEGEFRYPIIRTPREELGLSLGFRHRDGESVILDTITVPSVTSVVQFSQDYLRRDRSGAWAARSQFSLGTTLLNATDNPSPDADGQFFSWRGQVQRVQVLNPDNLLILRGDVQLANDSLLGSEAFLIGGGQSVRGFNQNARAGDNGVLFSIEDRIVLQRNVDNSPLFQVVPFMDLGAVWFEDPSNQPTNNNFLWGTGVGVIIDPLPGLNARFDVGIPLVELDEPGDIDTGVQFYFSLNYQF